VPVISGASGSGIRRKKKPALQTKTFVVEYDLDSKGHKTKEFFVTISSLTCLNKEKKSVLVAKGFHSFGNYTKLTSLNSKLLTSACNISSFGFTNFANNTNITSIGSSNFEFDNNLTSQNEVFKQSNISIVGINMKSYDNYNFISAKSSLVKEFNSSIKAKNNIDFLLDVIFNSEV
jgi:hypothetical protein